MDPVDERVAKVLARDVRAAARLMRDLDDERPEAFAALRRLYPHGGRASVIGVTGLPGAGKSTLVDQLVAHHRAAGRTVAVVAIDPTSPFTGGAILGDRIRMQRHAGDPGVFIRSLATRGALGGLSRSTRDVVAVFDAMGFDVVLIETVGVGQDEVDVARTAHTTLVVTAPGLGDGVQAVKAGLLEVADVFVVNKADRPDAERAVAHLNAMLDLAPIHGWRPPVLATVATTGEGIPALAAAIEAHRADLERSGEWARRARLRQRAELVDRVLYLLRRRAEAAMERPLDALLDALERRETDPYSAAEALLGSLD
jgi:LAO/AO transport system kinase